MHFAQRVHCCISPLACSLHYGEHAFGVRQGTRKVRVLITADVVSREGALTQWTLGSDATWKHHTGPIAFDHLFLGEVGLF